MDEPTAKEVERMKEIVAKFDDGEVDLASDKLTEEESVFMARMVHGVDEAHAEFFVALERGEIAGDVTEEQG